MLKKLIPALEWLPKYDKKDLSGDLSAGLIVAVMLIPQGMAYAMLAGLPPVVGLYAATIPLIIYALFGTSRQLAVGPVAMDSILVLAGVSTIAQPGSPKYISLALLLMLMVGIILLVMGILRLGFLVNFLSQAVISGFTSAVAIMIGLSQLNHLLGINLKTDQNVFLLIWESINRAAETHVLTFIVGVVSIIMLLALKRFPKVPAPLVVVILSITIVYFLRLDHVGINIIGDIPKGLPSFSLPVFTLSSVVTLLPIAFTIAFIAFMEAISIAKAFAAKEKYKIVPNQELIGLGLANVTGAFFSAYSVTGSLSRSAVNYQAGARTPLATMITAAIIILTLLFFTELFYFLPNAVLAAIIIVSVWKLVNIKEAKQLFYIRKVDGYTWVVTFIATLVFGIKDGVLLGIGFSLLVFIWRSAHPHVAELGYLRDKGVFKNIRRYPEAIVDPEVMIYRVDASLYFANMTFLEGKLSERIGEKPHTKWVVLDFTGVNSIDAVAIGSLEDIMTTYQEGQITFLFSGIKGPVLDLLKRANWEEKYGEKFHYLTIQEALKAIGK